MIDYRMDGSRIFSKLAGIFIFNFDCPIISKGMFYRNPTNWHQSNISDNVDELNSWRCSPQYYHKLQTAIEN